MAVSIDPGRALVLRSTSHLPMSWRDRAAVDWTWSFVLTALDGGQRSRYHFRSRWVTSPWWFTIGGWVGIVPSDFVMSRDHLHGVKERAERVARTWQPAAPVALQTQGRSPGTSASMGR
jgi:hypothetical protein